MYDADYEEFMQEQNDRAVGEYLRENFGTMTPKEWDEDLEYRKQVRAEEDHDSSLGLRGDPIKPESLAKFSVKDSGEKAEYDDGMQRDTSAGKPQFALMFPKDVPYEDQLLTRVAALYHSGGVKYGPRNWEKSSTEESLAHHEEALMRHVVRFLLGVDDGEDHGAAVVWNVNAVDLTRRKIREKKEAGNCGCLAGACTCKQVEVKMPKEVGEFLDVLIEGTKRQRPVTSDEEFITKTNKAVSTPDLKPTHASNCSRSDRCAGDKCKPVHVRELHFNAGEVVMDVLGYRWKFGTMLGEGSHWKSSRGGYTTSISDLARQSGPLTAQNGYTGLTILKDGSLKWA